MKKLLALLASLLMLIVSCTSLKEEKKIELKRDCKIRPHYDELNLTLDHLKAVINSQKGIEKVSKERFLKLTELGIENFKKLRAEELEIVKTLISKSIRYKSLSKEDVKSKNYYVKRLDKIFVEKERNILTIIDELKKVSSTEDSNELEIEMIKYIVPIL